MAKKKNPVIARSERLYLTPMSLEDAPHYLRWLNDPKIYGKIRDMAYIFSMEEEIKWIRDTMQDPTQRVFSLYYIPEDQLIGHCGFKHISAEHKTAEIWRVIGERAYWGKGLGSELFWLLSKYGFEELGFQNILAEHHADNPGSWKSAEKVGAKIIGLRRNAKLIDGKRIGVYFTDILPHELVKPKI